MTRFIFILSTLFCLFSVEVLAECRVAGCETPPRSEILSARPRNGLVFFFSPTCRYCEEQVPVLESFHSRYRWEIIPLDVNSRESVRYDIETTPTIVLVDRNYDEAIPVSIGLTSLSELELNVVAGLRYFNNLGQKNPIFFSKTD